MAYGRDMLGQLSSYDSGKQSPGNTSGPTMQEPTPENTPPNPAPTPPNPAETSIFAPTIAYAKRLGPWLLLVAAVSLVNWLTSRGLNVPLPPEVVTVPVETPDLVEHPPDVLHYCGRVESLADNLVTKPWPMKEIRWTVDPSGYSGSLTPAQITEAFDIAWKAWTRDVDILPKYTPKKAEAHVESHFEHIDGSSKILAWSELSDGTQKQKSQRYDRAERWTISANPVQAQIDMVRVACHEIGHVLGLVHDDVGTGALMEPTYSQTVRFPTPRDSQRLIALGYKKRPTASPVEPISISVAVDPEKLAEMLRRAGYEVKLIGR